MRGFRTSRFGLIHARVAGRRGFIVEGGVTGLAPIQHDVCCETVISAMQSVESRRQLDAPFQFAKPCSQYDSNNSRPIPGPSSAEDSRRKNSEDVQTVFALSALVLPSGPPVYGIGRDVATVCHQCVGKTACPQKTKQILRRERPREHNRKLARSFLIRNLRQLP